MTILGQAGGELELVSYPDAPDKRAKLWLACDEVIMGGGAYVDIQGGPSFNTRAILDLDVDVDVINFQMGEVYVGVTMIEGYASIDVATGMTFSMVQLTIGELNARSVVKLTVPQAAPQGVLTVGL